MTIVSQVSRLSHAYITNASSADFLAMAVVCSTRDTQRPCRACADCDKASRQIHPDITVVGRLDDKLIISVDQIRALKQDVYIVPNEAMQKAYVVRDADSMNANAQNAFLQILEEPPAHAVFILCTDKPSALLPTVRSRCVELRAAYGDTAEAEVDGSDTDFEELDELVSGYIDAIAGDNVKLMECMFKIDKLDRFALAGFLTLAQERLVLALKDNLSNGKAEKNNSLIHADSVLQKAKEMQHLNVSAGHIAGFICANVICTP